MKKAGHFSITRPTIKPLIRIAVCIGSCLAVMVFTNPSMVVPLGEMSEWGIVGSSIFIGLLAVSYFVWQREKSWNVRLLPLAAVLAGCMVVGRSFAETGSLNGVNAALGQLVTSVLFFLGYFYFFSLGLSLFLFAAGKIDKSRRQAIGKVEKILFEIHPFAATFVIILLCMLPYFIFFFPGTLQPDARGQINFYYGISPLSNHHPIFSTFYLGFLFDLGKRLFGSDNTGIMLYSIVQMLVQTGVFAYSFCVLKRLKTPMGLRFAALAYFALFPQWPIWAITFIKDTMHYVIVLLYVEMLIDILLDAKEGHIRTRHVVLFCLSGILAALIRHNGIIMVAGTMMIAILLWRKLWWVWIVGLLTMVAAVFMVNVVIAQLLHAQKWPVRESLSVPFQQTSRYFREYSDEVTQEELEAVTALFPYDVISTVDSPELSDPIKNEIYPDVTKEQMQSYWKTWAAQGLKHPGVYVQAFLNQCYGYFYPDRQEYKDGLGWWYLGDSFLEIGFAEELKGGRDFLIALAEWVRGLPAIGMLYSTGAQTYLLLACITAVWIRRRRKDLLLFLPGVITVMICLVSPVNAMIRYMLPVMAVLPLYLAWCFYRPAQR